LFIFITHGMTDHVYVLLKGADWEDIVVFLLEEEAIRTSKENPHSRVEIFTRTENSYGYTPTYYYYQNGVKM